MLLKVKGKNVDFFNSFTLSLVYNSIASAFTFDYRFDPNDPIHRDIFIPGKYYPCTVEHNGELLVTGTMLSDVKTFSQVPELATLAGYSKTGVLQDCKIPPSLYPLQTDGLSLKQIAEKIIKAFDIKLVVENQKANIAYYRDVDEILNEAIQTSTAYVSQSIQEYLTEIAIQKNILLTHNEKGNLVFTRAKTNIDPIMEFNGDMPGTKISLSFDGQGMHSHITVQKQADSDGGNAGEFTIINPYVESYRPDVIIQTSGSDVDTELVARSALAAELSKIRLTVQTDRWEIDGKIIRPNNTISVVAPHLGLFERRNWFIESVNFVGDQTKTIATINAVVLEAYNNQNPKKYFN